MRRIDSTFQVGRPTIVFQGSLLQQAGVSWAEKCKNGKWTWYVECRCACGSGVKTYTAGHVRDGTTRSCGCYQIAKTSQRVTKHGMFGTTEYRSWSGIVSRCTSSGDRAYDRYGGRGITVHPDWLGEGGFERFYAHIGPRPSPQHSVDRINNDGNYEPGNVRWATRVEQANNKRNNHTINFNGVTRTLAEWARVTGLSERCIAYRLYTGKSVQEALTKPVAKRNQESC